MCVRVFLLITLFPFFLYCADDIYIAPEVLDQAAAFFEQVDLCPFKGSNCRASYDNNAFYHEDIKVVFFPQDEGSMHMFFLINGFADGVDNIEEYTADQLHTILNAKVGWSKTLMVDSEPILEIFFSGKGKPSVHYTALFLEPDVFNISSKELDDLGVTALQFFDTSVALFLSAMEGYSTLNPSKLYRNVFSSCTYLDEGIFLRLLDFVRAFFLKPQWCPLLTDTMGVFESTRDPAIIVANPQSGSGPQTPLRAGDVGPSGSDELSDLPVATVLDPVVGHRMLDVYLTVPIDPRDYPFSPELRSAFAPLGEAEASSGGAGAEAPRSASGSSADGRG